jgi:hypothetical protein
MVVLGGWLVVTLVPRAHLVPQHRRKVWTLQE